MTALAPLCWNNFLRAGSPAPGHWALFAEFSLSAAEASRKAYGIATLSAQRL
ncbi:hypothetical protein [Halotia branconii]|uniref:Uncharacterized protein n=1 Tax=Halotia branconii CENA392 TaxID=1539056 RepID=A0AAJ6NTJ1_9CYAN|nr:hypothetical protein [Halotia branconii]WGV26273.1 hypothetical protein QI031_01800 [Halotia branconii CENA392]